MQSPNPKFAAIRVGTPIQMVNVQPKVSSVKAITTTLCYISKGDAGKTTSCKEALSPTNAVTAMDVDPASPHVGTGAKVIAHVAIPGPHPTAPHIVLPVAHHLGGPHIPKGTLQPQVLQGCYRCHAS